MVNLLGNTGKGSEIGTEFSNCLVCSVIPQTLDVIQIRTIEGNEGIVKYIKKLNRENRISRHCIWMRIVEIKIWKVFWIERENLHKKNTLLISY